MTTTSSSGRPDRSRRKWPYASQYHEAMQNPQWTIGDAELRAGQPQRNALGTPASYSGGFADVYQFHCPTGNVWAVKCFKREIDGLETRYGQIADCLGRANLSCMAEFQLLEGDQGIRIGQEWFPLVKMRWIEGLRLNEFIAGALDRPDQLRDLQALWIKLAARLRKPGIAHGDLQHGNVLLVPDPRGLLLRLVDYDGMFVPSLEGWRANESGHANYQHPRRRDESPFGNELDRFSHLVVYTALECLRVGGRRLWERYDNGENLLFTERDFHEPGGSDLFRELWTLATPGCRALVGRLALSCQRPLDSVPRLDELVSDSRIRALPRHEEEQAKRLLAGRQGGAGPRHSVFELATDDSDFELETNDSDFELPLESDEFDLDIDIDDDLDVDVYLDDEDLDDEQAFEFDDDAELLGEPAGFGSPDGFARVRPRHRRPLAQWLLLLGGVATVCAAILAWRRSGGDDAAAALRPVGEVSPIDLFAGSAAGQRRADNALDMPLRWCPAGAFTMGSPRDEPGRGSDESPVSVNISGFWIGEREVTQGEWRQVMGTTLGDQQQLAGAAGPPPGLADELAMYYVNHTEASDFCAVLTTREHDAGRLPMNWEMRLPTEAQWEYACRAGDEAATSFGPQLASDRANFHGPSPYGDAAAGPSRGAVAATGSYAPNRWGLLDMHGNVSEWCRDWYQVSLPGGEDPEAAVVGSRRLARGGNWRSIGQHCRSAYRGAAAPGERHDCFGFRIAVVRVGPPPESLLVAKIPVPEPLDKPPPPPAPGDPGTSFLSGNGMRMRLIRAGSFLMGGDADADRVPDERPRHQVTLGSDFYISETEVTQGEWHAVMQTTPWSAGAVEQGTGYPATHVDWDDAVEYCRRLSQIDGRKYRLPTEAEWEYACRAGGETRYGFGDDDAELGNYGWVDAEHAWPVASKLPNAWGLFDMHGNVTEWCADWYGPYGLDVEADPTGPSTGVLRVCRGGSWSESPFRARSAFRGFRKPSDAADHVGFRPVAMVRAIQPPAPTTDVVTSGNGMRLRRIPAGRFLMGSSDLDDAAASDELPQHEVSITADFYLGETEVTQRQWRLIMETTPWTELPNVLGGGPSQDDLPALAISWGDAQEYCRRISELEGERYRLPTEAEWEYACRCGRNTRFCFGDDVKLLPQFAWFVENLDERRASPVATRAANDWGLFDMHGNVLEWCSDFHGVYDSQASDDPTGPSLGLDRVARGGDWHNLWDACRASARSRQHPDLRTDTIGFRVARDAEP